MLIFTGAVFADRTFCTCFAFIHARVKYSGMSNGLESEFSVSTTMSLSLGTVFEVTEF